jgi:iron complex outermembrane receptor protein
LCQTWATNHCFNLWFEYLMTSLNKSFFKTLGVFTLSPICLALAGGDAFAQTTATLPEVVTILGSRDKSRTVFDSAVPIDRYSGAELEQVLSATGELGAALQTLAPSINQPRVSSSGASDSVRVIQLRGLAPDQVLVLVNGKRRHTNAALDLEGMFKGSVPVDLNTIPTNAIERIEVLRDGAGAQYGSDAIAGVINIVLKGGGTGGSASVAVGANRTQFAPTGTKIVDGQTQQLAFDQGLTFGNGATLRLGGEWQAKAGTNRAGPSDAGWTSWNSTPADLALDQKVLFKSGDPKVHSGNVFANATVPLQSGAQAYVFGTAHQRQTEGAAFFRYPGDPSNVASIYPNGYRPVTKGDITDTSLVAGTRFDAGPWSLDASARTGLNVFDYGLSNSLNASLGAASPTSFHLANMRSGQNSLNLDATRPVSIGGVGSPVNLALGAEFLQENYRTAAGDAASYAAGANTAGAPGAQAGPGLRPQDAVDLSRHVVSAYVDAEAEVTRDWLLAVALRQADYSDVGNSTTGKVSSRLKLGPQWLVRGSFSNSLRAPALAQTGFRFATLNFNADGTGLQNNALLPASDPLAQAFGAQPLKPETSQNLSLGFAWRPAKATSLTVDAYRIQVKDRITRTSDLQSDAVTAFLAGRGRTDIQSVAFLTNALDTTTTGLDLTVGHELQAVGGVLQLNAALNFNRTRIDRVNNNPTALSAIDPTLSLLGSDALLAVTHGSPQSKFILGAHWQGSQWGFTSKTTRYGRVWAYSYDSSAPIINGANAQPLGNTWLLDLEAQYKLSRNLTLVAGASNILDKYPPRTLSGSTYGGAFPYNYTDPTGLNGAYYYARASLTW